MSISNEIQKLQTNLANSYEACSDKGATMPASQNFDNLADCIDSIPTGSSLKRTFVLEEEINHVNTNNITVSSPLKIYNYTREGRVVDNNGIISDFDTYKYIILPYLNLGGDYEINFTFTPADFNADRPIISGYNGNTGAGDVFINETGLISLWDKSVSVNGATQMTINSKYSFKLVKNGSTLDMYLKSGSPSEDINDYTLEFSGATDVFSGKTIRVGCWGTTQYFTGTINMNESYIKWSNYIQWLGITKSQIVNNYSMVGHVNYNNEVLSNFYDSNSAYYANAFSTIPNLGNNPWEFECEFTTGSTINTDQEIIGISTRGASPFYIISGGLRLFLSSNGSNWDISNTGQSYLTLSANTTYKLKAEWTGAEYKVSRYVNGEWNVLTTATSSTPIHSDSNLWLGVNMRSGNPAYMFRGSINTNYCVLKSNRDIIWQGITQNS